LEQFYIIAAFNQVVYGHHIHVHLCTCNLVIVPALIHLLKPKSTINMKTNFIIISACILLASCSNKILPSATPVANQLTTDSKGTPMLAGHCTPSALMQQPFNKWYDSAVEAYKPNPGKADSLKQHLQHTVIEVFMGTWCGDSKREVPKLIKTLTQSGFDTSDLKLIMVGHEGAETKVSPQHEEKGKNIFRVPTAIVYKNNLEIGRIIETPVVSWEGDLLKLAAGQDYTPNYHAANTFIKALKSKKANDNELAKMAELYKPLFTSSGQLNSIGYFFLAKNKMAKAFTAFQLNTLLFPQDSNVWDSLAEAYATTGHKSKALDLYKKVLELKPGDSNATEQIKKLTE